MIYLMLYLLMGLAWVVSGMVAWRETPLLPRLLLVAVLWLFWPLMVALLIRERWALKHIQTYCAWCGEVMAENRFTNLEAWRQHALVCQKHPLRAELEALKARVTAFAGQLQAWGYEVAARELTDEVLVGEVFAPDYNALTAERDELLEQLKQVEANREGLLEIIHGCGFELYDNENGRIGLKRSDTVYLPLAATPRPAPAPYRGPQ